MLNVKDLKTIKFVSANQNLFESVASSHDNAKDVFKTQYSILNYGEILDKMIEFIDGYAKYAKSENNKFEGKVLDSAKKFYDNMFKDKKKYRSVINLNEFKNISKTFLLKTKKLQSIMDTCLKDIDSREADGFIRLTNNQYDKLSKCFKDDMRIYLWLSSTNSKHFAHSIDNTTKAAFNNKSTPVMHVYKKGDENV